MTNGDAWFVACGFAAATALFFAALLLAQIGKTIRGNAK